MDGTEPEDAQQQQERALAGMLKRGVKVDKYKLNEVLAENRRKPTGLVAEVMEKYDLSREEAEKEIEAFGG
ncbi:MAG: hypothetical protein V7742_11400 [Halioglobus sp.]